MSHALKIILSAALFLLASSPVTAAPEKGLRAFDLASARVDELFHWMTQGVQPGAAVLVIRHCETVHMAGYGYANLEEKTHITPESTFRLGSVSKQFTAMAIAMLIPGSDAALNRPGTPMPKIPPGKSGEALDAFVENERREADIRRGWHPCLLADRICQQGAHRVPGMAPTRWVLPGN